MKIKFIGTGSGLASLNRNHSSFVIYADEYKLLIDAGDGISKALLSNAVSYNDVNGILISHLHPDHFSGIAALLMQMKLTKRNGALDIFAHQKIIEFIKRFVLQSYVFIERLGFDINYRAFNDDESVNVRGHLRFYSKQNSHLNKYFKYDTEGTVKFSCSSFLFDDGKNRLYYSGDIGGSNDLYLFDGMKFKIMIVEASHVKPEEILNSFKEQKAEKLILTHISDSDEEILQNYFKQPEIKGKHDVMFAADGDVIEAS